MLTKEEEYIVNSNTIVYYNMSGLTKNFAHEFTHFQMLYSVLFNPTRETLCLYSSEIIEVN